MGDQSKKKNKKPGVEGNLFSFYYFMLYPKKN